MGEETGDTPVVGLLPVMDPRIDPDLEQRIFQRSYMPLNAVQNFLAGRGGNMYLLYNLLQEEKDALDPEVPLIFGAGVLTSNMPGATRGNVSSRSPESRAR